MARGTQLAALLAKLRNEARQADAASLGQNYRAYLAEVLQRKQRSLYEESDWRFLDVRRDVTLAAGQRYYAFPADLNLERITAVEIRWSGQWVPVEYGITSQHYNLIDSDADVREDPVRNWDMHEDGNFEVWPVPASNGAAALDGRIRFHGTRKLNPLIADSDTADLDDDLIVLFAAAEVLAQKKAPDAQVKLQEAQSLFRRLKGGGNKNRVFSMGGGEDERPKRRVIVTYARAV